MATAGRIPDAVRKLQLLAARANQEAQSHRAPERSISKASKVPAEFASRWPIRGPVNSEFGPRPSSWPWARKFHSGIDIGAARGTPVRAPTAGKVSFAGVRSEYGLTVILDHGRGVKTLYGHLQEPLVTRGQKVQQGQLIGLTGNSGKSSGPHLHYEIIVKGKPVNPRRYLRDSAGSLDAAVSRSPTFSSPRRGGDAPDPALSRR